jgi:hypothetical protein
MKTMEEAEAYLARLEGWTVAREGRPLIGPRDLYMEAQIWGTIYCLRWMLDRPDWVALKLRGDDVKEA